MTDWLASWWIVQTSRCNGGEGGVFFFPTLKTSSGTWQERKERAEFSERKKTMLKCQFKFSLPTFFLFSLSKIENIIKVIYTVFIVTGSLIFAKNRIKKSVETLPQGIYSRVKWITDFQNFLNFYTLMPIFRHARRLRVKVLYFQKSQGP